MNESENECPGRNTVLFFLKPTLLQIKLPKIHSSTRQCALLFIAKPKQTTFLLVQSKKSFDTWYLLALQKPHGLLKIHQTYILLFALFRWIPGHGKLWQHYYYIKILAELLSSEQSGRTTKNKDRFFVISVLSKSFKARFFPNAIRSAVIYFA